jgi:DNA-binding CsgD family transcriptional regulator
VEPPAGKGGAPRVSRPTQGTPQGGVISPLLSNIYLHWFDTVFHRPEGPAHWAGAKLVRYADDFVVLARFIDHRLTDWIEAKLEGWLGLCLSREKTRVVVLADTGESAQRYMGAGANGVVYRNVTSAALVDCVRKVARGENWVQDIAVPSELTENDMVGLRVRDRLTAKELRIVALIVQGYKNKEIASQLGTTEQVIKNYLRNVYDKIGVSDRLELALFTIHHRILNEAAAATAAAATPQAGAGVTS